MCKLNKIICAHSYFNSSKFYFESINVTLIRRGQYNFKSIDLKKVLLNQHITRCYYLLDIIKDVLQNIKTYLHLYTVFKFQTVNIYERWSRLSIQTSHADHHQANVICIRCILYIVPAHVSIFVYRLKSEYSMSKYIFKCCNLSFITSLKI